MCPGVPVLLEPLVMSFSGKVIKVMVVVGVERSQVVLLLQINPITYSYSYSVNDSLISRAARSPMEIFLVFEIWMQ